MTFLSRVIATLILFAFSFGLIIGLYPATLASAQAEGPLLSHQQETWISALEWCESRGVHAAINPKDLDGTPSYGGFQFKPSTLAYYATVFNVPYDGNVMDYDTQKAVVEQMVLHRSEITWTTQFPDCVKHYVGLPPA